MDKLEILNLEYIIKKELIKLKTLNKLTWHETIKSCVREYFSRLNLIALPEYRINFHYKSKRIEKDRKGRIDLVIKNDNEFLYGIEIDSGLSRSSITKLNQLNPKQKIIISYSYDINRHLWKLPEDFILIHIQRSNQYNLNFFTN